MQASTSLPASPFNGSLVILKCKFRTAFLLQFYVLKKWLPKQSTKLIDGMSVQSTGPTSVVSISETATKICLFILLVNKWQLHTHRGTVPSILLSLLRKESGLKLDD